MNAVLKTETIALESAAPLEVADPTKNLILVPLSQLLPRRSKRNVRTTPRQSIPELAASIARVGLLQNLIVILFADGEQYEVVAGDRRLPIERQARVIGATWLDQQLIGGGKGLGDLGFGAEVKDALRQRADFLAEEGLAEHRGQRVVLARNLLATLRGRELAKVGQDIASETGLEHRPVADGQRVAGIYRRSVMLASGRYAMLDDGRGFSLVPWRPVIDQRVGHQLAATVRDGSAAWEIGRQRGTSIS